MSDDATSEGDADEANALLADLAEERDLSERELLTRLLAGDGVDAPVATSEEVADLSERVGDLETSVSDLDDALDAKIQDVRERVVQVKRETDGKAPRDHDHPEFAEGLQRIGENLDALGRDFVDLTADQDRIEENVDDVDDRVDRGFSNFEEVLEYLIDVTDDLNRKMDTLATSVVAIGERVARLEASETRRDGVDRLRRSAQIHGVAEAKCGDCGASVDLRLLTEPDCPHCEASFAGLEPSRSFFGSSVLQTGRRPALEGATDRDVPDLDAIVGDDVDPPPEVNAPVSGSEEPGTGSPDPGSADETDGSSGTDDAGSPTSVEETGEPTEVETSGAVDPGGRPVDDVPGVGSTYAERLRDAGVETVGALADADPASLADRTGVASGRVDKWVLRAREIVEAD